MDSVARDPIPVMERPPGRLKRLAIGRWFGPAGFVALGVFVAGRLALEPLRSAPQVDDEGLDPYGAVETFRLEENRAPMEVAFFGSSQTIWGIVTQPIAKKLGRKPSRVVNLGTAGGTPFEMWNLVRRNPREFKRLRLAVIEINPFILRPGLEGDPRIFAAVSSRASLLERFMLRDQADRLWQAAEWVLPVNSVRRSLESALENIVGNRKWKKFNADLDQRIKPGKDWETGPRRATANKERRAIPPETAAKRIVGNWQISSFQDYALRSLLQWMSDVHVPVVLHQLPVHPEVARLIRDDPRYSQCYQDYCDYTDSLEPAPRAIFRSPAPSEFGGDAGDMADRTHLNKAGAMLYSEQLAEKIRPFMRRTTPPQGRASSGK